MDRSLRGAVVLAERARGHEHEAVLSCAPRRIGVDRRTGKAHD
jgi:hypothetical protein